MAIFRALLDVIDFFLQFWVGALFYWLGLLRAALKKFALSMDDGVAFLAHEVPRYLDAGLYGLQWLIIAYIFFLMAYNLARALGKRIPKINFQRPWYQWPGWLRRTLGRGRRQLRYFLRRRLPRLLGFLGKELLFYGRLGWYWVCGCWDAWVSYGQRARGALQELQEVFDWGVFLGTVGSPALGPIVWDAGRACVERSRETLQGHWSFVVRSLGALARRPWTEEWTVFRFFKHLLGITFGITFFFYLFLWMAYVVYFFCDCLFLLPELLCLHWLQPLVFPRPSQRDAFLKAYEIVVGIPRDVILIDLFETLPARVKAFKDSIFSREFFRRLVVLPLEQLLVALILHAVWGSYNAVVTAYWQTRYFLSLGRRLFSYCWRRRYVYRYFTPRALYARAKVFLGCCFSRAWWSFFLFRLRDRWRWFSFVSRRYVLVPAWRRWQYRYRKGRGRWRIRLGHWAAYGKLFGSLVCCLGLLAAIFFFFFI